MASLASASLLNRTVSVVSSAVSCRNVVAQKVSCVSFSGLRASASQRFSIVDSRAVAATRLRRISCAAEGAEEAVAAPAATDAPAENVAEIVRKVIAHQLASPLEKVLPNSKFADLGADSLDTVEIMMALEERFDITIDEDGAEKISTVQEAADLIEAEIKARA
ncbi:acyl carrier protein [Marchantia polymorpha subsp. ruderalis]|uniref:Acyl carrier protein n=1 Tax=Marchantia polymorpha TaxID=3197 RepID=A0A2R6X891_MARPO|nr:hypothetical protein MARPO_0030s0067 [Marchantia polymorpha]BBN20207.1 hypothetical protein Mp_8g17330 [Marchantia polymorpha subsp. ruderalis]|eukprot:PTQ42325.1 hypothetical protein MARPO_0030s0067 [Marchantia polymorpha]